MNNFRLKSLLFLLLMLFCISCQTTADKQLEQALQMAGSHRPELEKALNYYDPSSKDSLKYKAIHFLIRNMPGSWGVDSSFLRQYQPFYDVYHSYARKYNGNIHSALTGKIDSIWELNRSRFPRLEDKALADLHHISAARLISETELAFQAWEKNTYTRNSSFEDFCEYILPYRRKNGLYIDEAREIFYQRHHSHFFRKDSTDFIRETDSLLYLYRDITHNCFHGSSIPIPSASTLEYLGKGLCDHRCWFNSLLLSSLGMAVAVDFVPAWGNRNSSHTWNVLVFNGQSYAFESFWDNNRWKYKRIYNNQTYDPEWGSFRLPKVYRYTYTNHPEGPYTDSRVRPVDIPPLFKNTKKKDVSTEYFDTVNLTLPLTEIPEHTYYAYLCVFGYRQWHPVQWGKIEKNTVTFKGMGKDIVYLPAFCQEGEIIPAGEPFYLSPDKTIIPLTPGNKRQNIAIRNFTGAQLYQGNQKEVRFLAGCCFLGSNSPDFLFADTLGYIPDTLFMEEEKIPVHSSQTYRYIRLITPRDTFAAGEIRFYTAQQNNPLPAHIYRSHFTPFSPEDKTEFLTDHLSASCFKGSISNGHTHFIDFDLGESCQLEKIGVSLYLTNETGPDSEFELRYWDQKEWQTGGRQKGRQDYLYFRNIPSNSLYHLMSINGSRPIERIFLYENNEVKWK